MPAPTAVPGVTSAPPGSPGSQPLNVSSGGSGGGVFGVVVSEIQGFCIAFGSSPSTDEPLWVRLDDPNGPFAVQSFSIDRGRNYELDKMDVGTASVTIIDTSGAFDPTNPVGPFVNQLNPMLPAAIAIRNPVLGTWHTIFRGFTSRFSYDMYPTENFMTVTIDLVDGMDYLAAIEVFPTPSFGEFPLFGITPTDQEEGNVVYPKDRDDEFAVHRRITRALDEANWPAGLREIFSGNIGLKRTIYAPRSPLLSVIQDAAEAEFPGGPSVFFFAKDGKATFHGRFVRFNPADANYHIATWKAGDLPNVDADSTRALIFDLEFDRDKEKIINSALVTPQGLGDEFYESQYVEDVVSIASYGRKSISFENLIIDYDFATGEEAIAATIIFGSYFVLNYANPKTRVNNITFKGSIGGNSTYSDRVWRVLCNVEINDIISLKTTHDWVGTASGGFDEDYYVEGVHYEAQPQSDDHLDVTLTLDLSPKSYYDTNPF